MGVWTIYWCSYSCSQILLSLSLNVLLPSSKELPLCPSDFVTGRVQQDSAYNGQFQWHGHLAPHSQVFFLYQGTIPDAVSQKAYNSLLQMAWPPSRIPGA